MAWMMPRSSRRAVRSVILTGALHLSMEGPYNGRGTRRATAVQPPACAPSLRCDSSALVRCEVGMLCWETVMGNDLVSGFNGTQDVRVETQAFPQGSCLKERLWLPLAQCFVQQRNRRYFAVLLAIFPDNALSQGLCMTMHMYKTDFPAEWRDDFTTSCDKLFAIASIHRGKDHAIEVRLRGCSEHRIPEVPHQLAIGGGAEWKKSRHQVYGEVRMEELQPGQPGNLFGDGQLADRRRSIQQNQFHDALSYRMLLQPRH